MALEDDIEWSARDRDVPTSVTGIGSLVVLRTLLSDRAGPRPRRGSRLLSGIDGPGVVLNWERAAVPVTAPATCHGTGSGLPDRAARLAPSSAAHPARTTQVDRAAGHQEVMMSCSRSSSMARVLANRGGTGRCSTPVAPPVPA